MVIMLSLYSANSLDVFELRKRYAQAKKLRTYASWSRVAQFFHDKYVEVASPTVFIWK